VYGAEAQRHPYDLGALRNVQAVLGNDPAAWCMPSCQGFPGGLSYPTSFDRRAQDAFAAFFA
jgi:hypothetical protein